MLRFLLPIALLCIGCRHEPAADAVNRYFKAIAAGDCAEAAPLIADEKIKCEEAREEYQEQKVQFLGVQKVEPDGRDPKVTLVSVKLNYKKSDHTWIVRAENHDGHWKLRF